MLTLLQQILADACCAREPDRALREALDLRQDQLDEDTRRRLHDIDPAGLEFTALLIRQRRLQRLLYTDPALRTEHDAAPELFIQDAMDYFEMVPPTHASATEDAAAFHTYLDLLG